MFEAIAAGQRAREREDSRRADIIGDEDAMVICLPPYAEGILGDIVGHLNLLSPWNPRPENKDRDFFNDQWHIGEELGSRNADPNDNDLWIQGPSSHAYLGAMGYDAYGRDDLLPTEIEEVPQFRARLRRGERMEIRRDLRRACPGLYCTSPAYGYDLWAGAYEKEPAFWGKFSLSPIYGQSGPRESWSGALGAHKAKRQAKKGERHAEQALKRFIKKAEALGTVTQISDPTGTQVSVTMDTPDPQWASLHEIAKNVSRENGVIYTAQSTAPRVLNFHFGTNPTMQAAGYSASGVAALQVLLGALDGTIDCGQVIPIGNGQFGVVGAEIGKLFDFLKKKNKDDAEKGEKYVKKIDKLWAKIEKFNEKYKAESGKEHTPWKAAEASAKGFWSVGGGGGGHYWGQPEGAGVGDLVLIGNVESGAGGRRKQKMQQKRQKRQQKQQKQQSQQQQPQASPEAQPYQQPQEQPGSPWESPPAPAPFYPQPPMYPMYQPPPPFPMAVPFGYGGYGSYGGSPVPMVRGIWGEPVYRSAPAASSSPWEAGNGLRTRRNQFEGGLRDGRSRRDASAAGFWTDCSDDRRGIWRNSRNWDGQ